MQAIPIERITPRKASEFLNSNKSNRKLRDGIVEKYADDMRNGRWTKCPMPICFYEDGDIADGQHRLWAIIESDTTQEFPVLRGLSRTDGLNIDVGLNRTLVDNAKISGIDKDLTNELIAVARAVEVGERAGAAQSNTERLAMVEKHREACKWAITNGPRGKGFRNQLILGAVARAYYHENDTERLRRFCDLISTGLAESKDESAAISLRNYFIAKQGGVLMGAGMWRDTFLKCMNAISYFMQGKPLTVIKKVADEAYPLPKAKKPRRAA